jgi:hypothetical protein
VIVLKTKDSEVKFFAKGINQPLRYGYANRVWNAFFLHFLLLLGRSVACGLKIRDRLCGLWILRRLNL